MVWFNCLKSTTKALLSLNTNCILICYFSQDVHTEKVRSGHLQCVLFLLLNWAHKPGEREREEFFLDIVA